MAITLDQLNHLPEAEAGRLLEGLYEHTPWIAQKALAERPFASLAQLKHAMVRILAAADRAAQVALVCAHPELAGKAMQAGALTAESTTEQRAAGLTQCTPAELER